MNQKDTDPMPERRVQGRSGCRKPGGSPGLPPRPRDVIVISYSEPEPAESCPRSGSRVPSALSWRRPFRPPRPKTKARHTNDKVVEVGGVGEREPRRHGAWGEVGGEGSLRRRHPGRDPGRRDPQAEPPSRAFGLGHETGPPCPLREPQEELSRRLRRRWGLLEHPPLPAAVVLPPPRGSRSPRPAGRRAGEEESQPAEGAPRFPRASGTRARACRPGDNGREGGKKGLRNLAEELNGVERRGEGLGRGRRGGGGRSAAAGGRAASEALKVSLADIAAEPRTREAAAAAEEAAAAEAEGRPGPALARAPARGLASAAAPGSAADRKEELAGAPREDGAAGRLRGVSRPEPRRSEPRRPRRVLGL
ncbi:translation initiation factor IF-2-like [Cervus elaphus]|uniref:translation initiation factor IF-2-like n=1 Tax=Cervus elaphus TaxID=9860 RepID=UPI001CC2ECC9|nr:translation initiation factor IF-2-like [Cervus elaphus]